jgi:plasmid stabilization system protein ParE
MRFSFHPDAEAEFDKAVAYFEARQHGPGFEFADEVLVTVARILDYPKAGSPFAKSTRRCLAKPYPYGIIYPDSRGDSADYSCRSSVPLSGVLGING